MDAKLKAKAMTDDQLDGVAGGWIVNGGEKQDYETRLEIGTRGEGDNETRRELGDLFNSKGTKKEQPTLNTYSYKFP